MTNLNENKYFFQKLILIGVPVVLQNLISMGLNLIDTLMIGMVGEEQLAAVGAANQVYFIFTISLFGLYSGAAVHTAQYWGAKDIDGIKKLLGMDYVVGFVFASVVTLGAFIFAPQLIRIFSDSPVVIGYGVDYMRIACFSYVFAGFSFAISYNSRAIQNLKVPTIINAVALCINAVLNYILIFGKLGMPVMGVKGAAIATLIARVLEIIFLLIFVYRKKDHPFYAGPRELMSFEKDLFKSVMRTALPVVFTEGSWAVSMALIFAAYGKLGTSALAVAQVANVVTDLIQSLYFGVGNATAMLIGETLGQQNKEQAYQYGKKTSRITKVLNIFITIFLILISKPVANIYHFNTETTDLLVTVLCVMALLITPKMIAYMYIVGILRAGGDTVFCMKLELICNLCIQVPLAYIAVLVLHLSLPWAMVFIEIGDIIRIGTCVPRFRSKKWINIVTRER
ncbi:MAG: MATE family efflux transporter [Anaerovoracaceae bacterium]